LTDDTMAALDLAASSRREIAGSPKEEMRRGEPTVHILSFESTSLYPPSVQLLWYRGVGFGFPTILPDKESAVAKFQPQPHPTWDPL
jgi:hypothetical protein